MNNEQLTEACKQLMRLLDAVPQWRKCDVCDVRKKVRFLHTAVDEVACEDCVKNHALLAIECAEVVL
jgi:hypothetical protein